MRTVVFFCFLIFIVTGRLYSFSFLHGEIGDTVFEQSGNPYRIDSTVIVKKGCTVEFKEGCIVLVNNYCGIEVNGNFIVKGTLENPVVFTTVNDNRYNPQSEEFPKPHDWVGILFELASDTVLLENIILTYSVYGIKSWNKQIVIHHGLFNYNGQYDVVVNDVLQQVTPDTPFSYNYTPPSEALLKFQRDLEHYERKVRIIKTIKLSTLITGAAGAGLDVFFIYKYIDFRNQVPNYRGPQNELEDLKNNRDFYKKAAIISGVCSSTLLLSSLTLHLLPLGDPPIMDRNMSASLEFRPGPFENGVFVTFLF